MANLEQTDEDPKHVKMSTKGLAVPQSTPNGQSTVVARDPGALPCLIPSFADACTLVSAPYSCLVMDTHRRHIALSPMFLQKKRTGIQDELNTELLRYSENLKGVPLAYDNIRILGQQGQIYDDSGYIHLNIEASFVVFQPQEGQKLLGVVNKLGVNHAGCLVHGCFNASVPKPTLVSLETWREAGPKIGEELEFEVLQLDADTAGVLLIRGQLDRTRVQELMARGESPSHDVCTDQQEEPGTEPSAPEPPVEPRTQDSPDTPTPKKKKKKKDKRREEEEEEEAAVPPLGLPGGAVPQEENGTAVDSSITPEKRKKKKREKHREAEEEVAVSCPRLQRAVVKQELIDGAGPCADAKEKKKKKKEKGVKEEEIISPITPIDMQWSNSSGYLSDNLNGKRKKVLGDDITSCFHLEPESPRAKKKKRVDVLNV